MLKRYLKNEIEIREEATLSFGYNYWIIRNRPTSKKQKLKSTFYHTNDFIPSLFYKHICRSI